MNDKFFMYLEYAVVLYKLQLATIKEIANMDDYFLTQMRKIYKREK